ncbi:hypothetical protein N9241_02090 [bacterium]|nr:hypothetical protein [bacterium]
MRIWICAVVVPGALRRIAGNTLATVSGTRLAALAEGQIAATIGYKEGNGNVESAGAEFGREGAFSMVCYEVQDIPQTINNSD